MLRLASSLMPAGSAGSAGAGGAYKEPSIHKACRLLQIVCSISPIENAAEVQL